MRIAFLEDDPSQTELFSHWFVLAGHHPHPFDRGAPLLRALEQESFDVLLLDWNVPEMSGIDVLRHVRQRLNSAVPVLFSTARSREEDVVKALREGADGYVTKPVRRLELLARLESLAQRRREWQQRTGVLELEEFRVDLETRTIVRNNIPLRLTAKDFDLSALFLRNIGRLLSRGHIRETVWSANQPVSSRTIDTHVSRVRNKLGLTREQGWRLVAVYGYGYRLERLQPRSPRTPTPADANPPSANSLAA
ncbi:MAG TPA: response regulator transcription factor [Burkholderiales bacterium]|nr:response regulator transcription factor [Burkholderiales bacterium]